MDEMVGECTPGLRSQSGKLYYPVTRICFFFSNTVNSKPLHLSIATGPVRGSRWAYSNAMQLSSTYVLSNTARTTIIIAASNQRKENRITLPPCKVVSRPVLLSRKIKSSLLHSISTRSQELLFSFIFSRCRQRRTVLRPVP